MLKPKKRKTKAKIRRFCVDNFFSFFCELKKYLFLNDILCNNTLKVVRRLTSEILNEKSKKHLISMLTNTKNRVFVHKISARGISDGNKFRSSI